MKRLTARQLRHYWPIFVLLLPTFLLIGFFSYFPAASAVGHSFYRWDGDDVLEWVGLGNFEQALNDKQLGKSFGLVMIFIASNLVKMTPSILIAVLIHRLASNRWRYLYRIFFVLPMIIPGMVWLLIWKYFYNPNYGVLNDVLNGTGMMQGLAWLDVQMPALAQSMAPLKEKVLQPIFGSTWGFGIFGALTLGMISGMKPTIGVVREMEYSGRSGEAIVFDGIAANLRAIYKGWMWWLLLLVGGFYLMGAGVLLPLLAALLASVQVARLANVADRRKRRQGLLTIFAITSAMAVAVFAQTFGWKGMGISAPWLAVAFTALMPLPFLLTWLAVDSRDGVKWIGLALILAFAVLVLTTMTWTEPTQAFKRGRPNWLGDKDLIPTALIFWGFPWVGIVSVLLYLSGLGNIDQSVYEAAEIDGCGWFRKFWNVELPLIMTQVRLNLVLMVIGTLQAWGQVFILLGDSGGPDGAGMLPGLYMFHQAFTAGQAGYGCAIGLLLFFLILFLTLINNKYVRVDK